MNYGVYGINNSSQEIEELVYKNIKLMKDAAK
jgi:hypothetical protein